MTDGQKSRTRISPVLIMAGGLLAIAAGTVVETQFSSPVQAHAAVAVVAQRDIRFADRPNGGVEVTNAADNTVIAELAPESNNFIRALMRGLVRQRVREGDGPQTPFRLTAWADGGLTLEDPDTHRSVELGAFGPTNAESFVQMLPLKGIPQ